MRGAPGLTQWLQTGRAVLRFGPWHHFARAIIRRCRRPETGIGEAPFPGQFDAAELTQGLRADGVAMANYLPHHVLDRVREITDMLPPGEYGDFQVLPDIFALVYRADVLSVVRGYFDAEPVLLECNLVVAHAEDPTSSKVALQRHFHMDYAGWHALNLFVYLTDVDEDSGAHQVVAGTHRAQRMRDVIRPCVPQAEIDAKYGGRVRTITGRAGTMFFEDTAALHRRQMLRRRRVILNVLYASHRSWLSKGRLIQRYSDYLLCSGPAG